MEVIESFFCGLLVVCNLSGAFDQKRLAHHFIPRGREFVEHGRREKTAGQECARDKAAERDESVIWGLEVSGTPPQKNVSLDMDGGLHVDSNHTVQCTQ